MEARNCPRCGKIFSFSSKPICPNCEKAEEEIFQRVRAFLEENPSQSLAEVAVSTQVSPRKILGYVQEGRLMVTDGMRQDVVCESCGKPILQGRYCDKCVIQLNQKITDVFSKHNGTGMHINESKRK